MVKVFLKDSLKDFLRNYDGFVKDFVEEIGKDFLDELMKDS